MGGESSLEEKDAIEEFIIGLEAPRLSLNQRGLANHQSYPFSYEFYGTGDIGLSVTKITPES